MNTCMDITPRLSLFTLKKHKYSRLFLSCFLFRLQPSRQGCFLYPRLFLSSESTENRKMLRSFADSLVSTNGSKVCLWMCGPPGVCAIEQLFPFLLSVCALARGLDVAWVYTARRDLLTKRRLFLPPFSRNHGCQIAHAVETRFPCGKHRRLFGDALISKALN